MKLDLSYQALHDTTLPPMPVKTLTGSALPIEIAGVPASLAGEAVTGVTVSLTNADAVTLAKTASRQADGVWSAVFPASHFTAYGLVYRGCRISAVIDSGEVILAAADVSIYPAVSDARAGDQTLGFQLRGDDHYVKSSVVDGVQHYKKQILSFDSEMYDWGLDWTGDYILVNGVFVSTEAPAEETAEETTP